MKKKEENTLKVIEKIISKNLKEISKEEIFGFKNGYTLDDEKNIIGLNLEFNKISDYSFLEDFENLFSLNLEGNGISDISFLEDFKKLTHLDLEGNRISDISALKNLKNLSNLNLKDNKISDISFLKNFEKLTSLGLGFNKILNIDFLKIILKNNINLKTSASVFHELGKISLGNNLLEDSFITAIKKGRKTVLNYPENDFVFFCPEFFFEDTKTSLPVQSHTMI